MRDALSRRGRRPRKPYRRLLTVGAVALSLALATVLWKQRHRLTSSSPPPYPGIQVDKDKPVLIKVFFGSTERQRLEAEARTIYETERRADQAKQAVLELLKGPRSALVAVVPPGTQLKELYIDEAGTAYVDMSKEISSKHPGGVLAERLTIAAIVNTLTYNFPDINHIRLFVDGEPRETLAGHVRTGGPLSRDRELVARP